METSDVIWSKWIKQISDWGYGSLAFSLLDAMKPLSLVFAQMVYVCSPVLSPFISSPKIKAAAELLEDREAYESFCQGLTKVRAQ